MKCGLGMFIISPWPSLWDERELWTKVKPEVK